MSRPTTPSIFDAENTPDARRLVAAQARMYSDAKALFTMRIDIVLVLAVAAMIAACLWPEGRIVVGAGGGVLTLVGSFVVAGLSEFW